MMRYFFDIQCLGLKSEDQHGTVLPDAATAKSELLTAVIETATGAFRGVENAVISGSVREQDGPAFFECHLELRSKLLL